jgi:DUF4097 and DUF4098 domain-containing protein YvlB
MKKHNRVWLIVGFGMLIGFSTLALAQEGKVDRATVPFSDPSSPGTVKVTVFRGGITVTGYSGKEVIVEARVRSTALQEREDEEEVNEKAKGMRLIRSSASGLSITEEDNVMSIGSQSMKTAVDITIQVPFKTTLKLGCFNNGDISVEKVTGEVEVNNHNGGITLSDITGSVVANTFNGELKVTFVSLTPDKPMSFTTWNGDVDITLPASLKADVKMNSQQGDIYSDFDVQIKAQPPQAQEEDQDQDMDEGRGDRRERARYRISFDKTIYGAINGGGPVFTFKTFNGDIYIRKK